MTKIYKCKLFLLISKVDSSQGVGSNSANSIHWAKKKYVFVKVCINQSTLQPEEILDFLGFTQKPTPPGGRHTDFRR